MPKSFSIKNEEIKKAASKFKGNRVISGYSDNVIKIEGALFYVHISSGGRKPYTRNEGETTLHKLQIVATREEDNGTSFYGLTYDNQKVKLFVIDKKLAIPDPKTNIPILDENGKRKYILKTEISAAVLEEWPEGLKMGEIQ